MRLLLIVLFIVVPIAELAVLIQVGQAIGVWWTIALLVADAILGSMLARSQGRAVWRRFNEALQAGRAPAREVMDGALVLFGGALLLTPGFLSDILGDRAAAAADAGARARDPRAAVRRADGGVDDGRAGRARPDARLPRGGRPMTSRGRRWTRRPTGWIPDRARRRDRRGPRSHPGTDGSGVRRCGDVRVRRRRAQLYGLARIGLSPGEDGEGRAAARSPCCSRGASRSRRSRAAGSRSAGGAGWDSIALGGLRMDVTERPLRDWTVAMEGEQQGFELRFQALSPPALIAGDDAVARAGGMAGYEQLCGVTGVGAGRRQADEVRCLGQRGHGWGEPDWDRIDAARTIAAWLEDGYGVALDQRAAGGRRARRGADLGRAARRGGNAAASTTARLSTTYDADGRQRRAGLELWVGERVPLRRLGRGAVRVDARPRRAAPGLRVLPLADRGRDRRRPVRRAAPRLAARRGRPGAVGG